MRTVCVWYPDWPLPEGDLGRPVFVFEDRPRGPGGETQRVRAANQAAVAAGIQLGMGRRAAEALCPMAQAIPRDLGAETRRFEQVVQTLENLIPRVEVMEPGLAMLPTVGALRYYGGEHELVTTIARELNKVATGARLGVADGPFAARWAAMTAGEGPRIIVDTVAFLADLDVSVLERDELIATFRWLGITTLGDLAVLPRPAVASRFGEAGLDAHRLASGEDRQPQPRPVPAHLAVESHFDDALESLDQVAFAARALSARLMIGLRREGIAPHRVEIEAQAANGVVRARTWRSTDPFIEATLTERVWWQLRVWVEQEGVVGGLVRLRLDPSDLSGDGRQLALLEGVDGEWQTTEPDRPQVERSLARAQALVGPEGVLLATRQGGRMPAEQIKWHRFGEEPAQSDRKLEDPWPGATPAPTPALVPPEPIPLAIEWDADVPVQIRLGTRWEPVLNWAGPWRLLGRWWRGEGSSQRYQIVTSAGAFLVVVNQGQAYLAAIYD